MGTKTNKKATVVKKQARKTKKTKKTKKDAAYKRICDLYLTYNPENPSVIKMGITTQTEATFNSR